MHQNQTTAASSTLPIPAHVRAATRLELAEGDTLVGNVVALPARGAHSENRMFLETLDRVVSIPASGRVGWVVLERELQDHSVQVGDRVRVTFKGWRRSNMTGNPYRWATVDVLRRVAQEAVR